MKYVRAFVRATAVVFCGTVAVVVVCMLLNLWCTWWLTFDFSLLGYMFAVLSPMLVIFFAALVRKYLKEDETNAGS